MPIRGESVGTAYVRIVADGSGLPQSIRDEFNSASKEFDDAGNVGAKQYKKSFAEELAKSDEMDLGKAFNEALAKDDVSQAFFEGDKWKKFETNMRARFGEQGQIAADEMKAKFLKAGSLDGMEAEVSRVTSRINANIDAATKKEAQAVADRAREMTRFEQDFRSAMNEADRVSEAVGRDAESNLHRFSNAIENLGHLVPALGNGLKDVKTASKDAGKEVDRASSLFTKMANTVSDLSDKIGTGFGKGNRNNFINFVGSFVGGLVKMISLGPRMIGNITEFTTAFGDAQQAGEGFFSSLSKGFSGAITDSGEAETAVGGLASTGVPGILALAAAFVILVSALGPIAALISGIAAALTALVGSLAFAVVGAVAPLAGLVVPLAAALGTVVAMVLTLSKTFGGPGASASTFFKPLVDAFTALGKIARSNFVSTLTVDMKDLTGVMKTLSPLFAATARALGHIASLMVDSFKSPSFDHFVVVMSRFVPHALDSLGRSVSNLGLALGNIFIDLIPSTNSFLGWLEKITGEFAKWTSSSDGKHAVLHFLEQAEQSAKAVGGFLTDVTNLLFTILQSGKGTGDNIFTTLGDKVKQFNQFLKDNPKALGDFFKNGKDTADSIGHMALDLGKLFDTLDSPSARHALHLILDLINAVLDFGTTMAEWMSPITTGVDNLAISLHWLYEKGKDVPGILHRIGQAFADVFHFGGGKGFKAPDVTGWVPGATSAIRGFVTKSEVLFGSLRDRLSGLSGDIKRNISTQLGALPVIASGIWNRIKTAAGAAWSGIRTVISTDIGQIVTAIRGLPGRISNLAGDFTRIASGWGTALLRVMRGIPGQIAIAFAGLGARIAAQIGGIALHFIVPALPHFPSIHLPSLPHINLPGPSGLFGGSGSPTTTPPPKTFNNVFNITTPTEDTAGVARQVIAQMVATGY